MSMSRRWKNDLVCSWIFLHIARMQETIEQHGRPGEVFEVCKVLSPGARSQESMKVNQKQQELIETVMDMVSHTAEMMLKDPFYAPPTWIIENWWHSLNAVLKIGDHADSKANSLEATDQAESEKGD